MSAIVDNYSERYLQLNDDLEPYNLTDNSSEGFSSSAPASTIVVEESANNTTNEVVVPKLHYEDGDRVQTYLRVVIAMQIFTFTLVFIIYLLMWRARMT